MKINHFVIIWNDNVEPVPIVLEGTVHFKNSTVMSLSSNDDPVTQNNPELVVSSFMQVKK